MHSIQKYITNVLNKNSGNVTNAAKESEIERQYLQRMLKRYNIKSKDIFKLEKRFLRGNINRVSGRTDTL